MNARYRVELTQYERNELGALLSRGEQAARKLKRAQILLAADVGGRRRGDRRQCRGRLPSTYIRRVTPCSGSPNPYPTSRMATVSLSEIASAGVL
jgi:hypothetical protein